MGSVTTTNLPPAGSDDIGVEDALAFVRTVRRPDKAEIKVSSVPAFAAWCERHFGPTTAKKPTNIPTLTTFGGVPVVVSHLLPPMRAALIVNDEIQAIIDLDARPLSDGDKP